MQIYKAEQDDGLSEQLEKSVAKIAAQIKIGQKADFDQMMGFLRRELANVQSIEELIGIDQPDLALVVSVLASVGWNLNDDIFTNEELWKARTTAIHKPINDMHDANVILGHIVDSYAVTKDGAKIPDGAELIPSDFDVEVAGVLYRAFEKLKDRIDEIISDAESGKMFVSMEAWFNDFAYGFLNPETGQTQVVERNETTAFLTKHLRSFGGSGLFKGYRIGRVLKDFIFAGEGFVEMPANPESVIKVAASVAVNSRDFKNIGPDEIPEGGVVDMENQELKELQEKLNEAVVQLEEKDSVVAKLTQELEEIKANDYATTIEELNTKIDELQGSVAETDEKLKSFETEKEELQKQLDEATQKAESTEAELDDIRKIEKARERMAKLSEVKVVENEEETLAELREMSDETFDLVIKYAGKAEEEEEEKEEVKAEEKEDEAEEEEKAEAALSEAEEKEGDPDLQTGVEDPKQTEAQVALATARALLGCENEEDN